MEEYYSSFITTFLSESFKKLDSHYCDVLIIDISNLTLFKPSLYAFDNSEKYIYNYMNIDTVNQYLYTNSELIDLLDTYTLKKSIDFVIKNKHITLNDIYKHIESLSDDFNEIYAINTFVERFAITPQMHLYFDMLSKAIWEEIDYQCKGYNLYTDTYITENTGNIYIYDRTTVQFDGIKSDISLVLRFFRKKT